jgi:hypothetical protein
MHQPNPFACIGVLAMALRLLHVDTRRPFMACAHVQRTNYKASDVISASACAKEPCCCLPFAQEFDVLLQQLDGFAQVQALVTSRCTLPHTYCVQVSQFLLSSLLKAEKHPGRYHRHIAIPPTEYGPSG